MLELSPRSLIRAITPVALAFALAGPASAASWSGIDGISPTGRLCKIGSTIYGLTAAGGQYNQGTVYKVSSNGSGYSVIYEFTGGADGGSPDDILVGTDGNLYVTTLKGGAQTYGVLDRITPSGTQTLLYTFTGTNSGAYPIGITTDSSGNIFGVAYHGGNANSEGTFWEYSSTGVFTDLHNFNSATDGAHPDGGIYLDTSNSTIYGTTPDGANGYGSFFSMTVDVPTPTFTSMYLFNANGDGCYPHGTPMKYNGLLYGTTVRGIGPRYGGNIFSISETGTGTPPNFGETSLAMLGVPDEFPETGLMIDNMNPNSGILYGTGEGNDTDDYGSIYAFNAATNAVSTIYTFPAPLGIMGGAPGALFQLPGSSTAYFITGNGGPTNCGVLYSIALSGTSTATPVAIHSFNTITLESTALGQSTTTDVVSITASTARPNDLLIANMTGYATINAFTGPAAVTINGVQYHWTQLSGSGFPNSNFRQEVWYLRMPPMVSNQAFSFTTNSSDSITEVELDVYAGTDPLNPVTRPGFDAAGTQVTTQVGSANSFNGASVTTVSNYSYIAEYGTTLNIVPNGTLQMTAGAGYRATSSTMQRVGFATVWISSLGEFASSPTTPSATAVTPSFSFPTANNTQVIAQALSLRLPNSTP